MQTEQRPMAGMDHIARHVVWDRSGFARQRGHKIGSDSTTGGADLAQSETSCDQCGRKITVLAVKDTALVITDELTITECTVDGHVLGG